MAQDLLLPRIGAQRNLYLAYLLHVSIQLLCSFKEYYNGIFRNSGRNCFWIVNNSLQVFSHLSTLNKGSKAKHLDTFDFATLYTNIPHVSLKCNLKVLINEVFKVQGAQFLSLNRQDGV